MGKPWYLLSETEPRGAAENMARDQHLLELVEAGILDRPVLRLYAWIHPTLSLGYHQRWQDTVDQEALARYGIELVRRWTGGRGVLHEPNEITYSVIAPLIEPFKARVTHNYQLIGTALERFTILRGARGVMAQVKEDGASVRAQRGLPCFASLSQSEIETSGQKLIGSAQKLGKSAFLQHGSIPMIHRSDVLHAITKTRKDVSALMTGMVDLYQAAGMEIPSLDDLKEHLIQCFRDVFDAEFQDLNATGLLNEERIAGITKDRFADDAWTYRK